MGSASTLTMSGILTGTSNTQLTQQGAGTLTLSGNNSGYNGPYTISTQIGNGTWRSPMPTPWAPP